MIRIEQTTKARRKLFPSDEYCINKNGEYFYLTKVELQKMACDLNLLGIGDVVGRSEQFYCECGIEKEDEGASHCQQCTEDAFYS